MTKRVTFLRRLRGSINHFFQAKDDLSRILKHSEDLHNVLKGIFSHVKSTQVILEAFAEELQDVKVETHEPAPTFDENPAFEKALKATIEKFKGPPF